ncbi:hypothetical protein VHUM_02053 [Vanrija humicola]|uniref:Uncharacterized protein n=1 Tax=Vanrija humicola TaxID=5417 RepID=A0A7D8V5P9_VANHU|nr:hypothetical protein VHUM_02053 [Vanrija humicola]
MRTPTRRRSRRSRRTPRCLRN